VCVGLLESFEKIFDGRRIENALRRASLEFIHDPMAKNEVSLQPFSARGQFVKGGDKMCQRAARHQGRAVRSRAATPSGCADVAKGIFHRSAFQPPDLAFGAFDPLFEDMTAPAITGPACEIVEVIFDRPRAAGVLAQEI
jgi:hypothetical protein